MALLNRPTLGLVDCLVFLKHSPVYRVSRSSHTICGWWFFSDGNFILALGLNVRFGVYN